jgi:YVTN family beta-propeller protein
MKRDGAGLVERGRVALAADAWGVAISPDQRRAVVTSAWTHTVSVVDLETLTVTARISVRREPRGVVVQDDGKTVWVSHLMGSALTRIDGIDGASPTVREVPLAPSPLRAPVGKTLDASLGYSLAISPGGKRLFAPRHALGALGVRNWYGAPTVDVLDLTKERSPIPPRRAGVYSTGEKTAQFAGLFKSHGQIPFVEPGPMVQPRGVVYRHKTDTLLVVAEGTDALVELDATSPDPALKTQREIPLGGEMDVPHSVHETCAAPSGLALSRDEATAWVFCRASYDVVAVDLAKRTKSGFRIATDPLGAKGEKGRRLFYAVGDVGLSGGLGCAGCHPDGRDDGHTWHEVTSPETGERIFVAEDHAVGLGEKASGFPRQTQMLAGRVAATGPYGWHAQAPTLEARAQEGFALHRWDGARKEDLDTPTSRLRAKALAPFLREGLVPPPTIGRPLNEQEELGKRIFNDARTACATCHLPDKGYTDRFPQPLRALPTPKGFGDDPNLAYKTPPLAGVGGTPPYYHDGSVPTLEQLIDLNHDRMGRTDHLSRVERAALVAFLETL